MPFVTTDHHAYSCGCKLSAEDLYKIDKTAMAEILAVGDADSVQESTEDVVEVLKDLQLGVLRSDNGLEDDDEELTMELEELLKTCDRTQGKPAREADSREESVDDGVWQLTNHHILNCDYLDFYL